MRDLARLICGQYGADGDISTVLNQVALTIVNHGQRGVTFVHGKKRTDLATYGPYCGRVLLEAACTALIARLDPFRILAVKRFQEHPDYDVAQRHKISIQWRGDVVTVDKPPSDLWAKEPTPQGIPRALLSAYFGDLYWAAGQEILLDSFDDTRWVSELKKIPPDAVTTMFRSEAEKLYASLSKGIHPEFVIPPDKIYDSETVIDLLVRSIALITKMACVSHCIVTAGSRLRPREVINIVKRIEQRVSP